MSLTQLMPSSFSGNLKIFREMEKKLLVGSSISVRRAVTVLKEFRSRHKGCKSSAALNPLTITH